MPGRYSGVLRAHRGLRWHVIAYALWFSWAVALASSVHGLGREGRRRLAVPTALFALVGLVGEIVILTRPLRWEWILALRLAWSGLGGVLCALAVGRDPSAVPLGARLGTLRATLVRSWRAMLGCGALFYLVVLGDVALLSTLWQAIHPEARSILTPHVVVWATPGFALGALLRLWWEERGVPTTRAVGNLFVGTHLLLLGMVVVFVLAAWLESKAEPSEPLELVADVTRQAWIAFALVSLPTIAFAAWISLAATGRRAAGRALFCVLLCACSVAQSSLDQVPGLWNRARALRDERAVDPMDQRRAIAAWERYLTAFPETDERAETLWRIATSHARLGDHAAARVVYTELAALPADLPGQRYARWSRLALAHAPEEGRRVDATAAPAIAPADYLTPEWRSVLALLASGRAGPKVEELLVGLRKVSLASDRLELPALTNLFEAKAYARLLGVEIRIAPLTLDDVRARLSGGEAVLVEARGHWVCLVGVEPAWGSFLVLDYERETDAVRDRELRAQAQVSARGGSASTTRLRDEILDELPMAEVAQMLADRQLLAATLVASPAEGRTAAAEAEGRGARWDRFLVAELAMDAGDPVTALDHYAEVAAHADWVLPYVHIAARTASRPPREIVERRIPMQWEPRDLEAWRTSAAHAALLRRAAAAFEKAAPAELPTPVLERLGALLDAREPSERVLRAEVYETLSARHPDEPSFLTELAKAHLAAGDLDGLVSVYRRLAPLEWGTESHRLHLADALVRLGRAGEARIELARVRARSFSMATPELLALEGRAALALGENDLARARLDDALTSRVSDPGTRATLALALEAEGRPDEALREWRWVDWTGIDRTDVATARARVGAGGGGGR